MKEDNDGILVTESLAVKHRPKVLSDLVGQPGIQKMIQGMVNTKKYARVYLISGNSGVGKTTVANLLNRYINCKTLNACGKCESCMYESHPDLLEVNVGDTRGIDDMRNIVSISNLMPRYNRRIILLDEAHSLTKQAEGCLLIPLEKKKSRTIFILASTNPEKILDTIKGRCVKMDLVPVSSADIAKRLFKIAKREGINFNDIDDGIDALEIIAERSYGQVREAVQSLESLMFMMQGDKEGENVKELVKKYIGTTTVKLEKTAANFLYSILTNRLKETLQCVLIEETPRQLLSKTRWVIHMLLMRFAGVDKDPQTNKQIYKSAVEKLFYGLVDADPKFQMKYADLVVVQYLISKIEVTMNETPIDERVLITSMVGEHIRSNKELSAYKQLADSVKKKND